MFKLPKSTLARRLMKRILIAALLMMLLSLVGTASLTWFFAKADLENQLEEVEMSYLDIIRSALWENDEENLNVILLGLSKLPGIRSAHIHEKGDIRFNAGEEPAEGSGRSFPIRHAYNGKVYALGELHLETDSRYVAHEILREVVVIALSEAAIILLVSILLFLLIYRSVIRRLLAIQSHTASLSAESLSEPMTARTEAVESDELDDLRHTINHMQKNLYRSFEAQSALEEALRQDREKLEDTVKERTASLRAINDQLKLEINEKENLQAEREKIIADLKGALDEIRKLSGMLPICASCKKIRDDKGYWNQLEDYISNHSEAVFSHSICPDCAKKLYPEFDPYRDKHGTREPDVDP